MLLLLLFSTLGVSVELCIHQLLVLLLVLANKTVDTLFINCKHRVRYCISHLYSVARAEVNKINSYSYAYFHTL